MAEHNGSYTVAFKNIFDWSSRLESTVFRDKPLLLMATSPGARGGQSVLKAGSERFSLMGAKELISFSFPSFYDNFKEGKIIHKELFRSFKEEVNKFENAVNK